MASSLTLRKRRKFAHKSLQAFDPFDSKTVGKSDVTVAALLDCIQHGDSDAFRDVLALHISQTNKTEFAKVTGIGRRTLYEIMDFDKPFNPELSTLMAIFEGFKKLSKKKKH